MTLHQRFTKHFRARGLTQLSFARLADIPQPNLSRIMNELNLASAREAISIHNASEGRISFKHLYENYLSKRTKNGGWTRKYKVPSATEFIKMQRKLAAKRVNALLADRVP